MKSGLLSSYILLLVLILPAFIYAQSSGSGRKIQTDTVYKTEVGFNITEMVKTAFFPNKLELMSFFPYDFTYKHLKKSRKSFYRLGITFRAKREVVTDLIFLRGPLKIRFALRSGHESHYKIHNNLYFIKGHDFRTGFDIGDMDAFGSQPVQFFMGYAFTFGLDYRIRERFRFYTEAAFLMNIHGANSGFFGPLPEPVFGNPIVSGLALEINIPTFLVFSYAF